VSAECFLVDDEDEEDEEEEFEGEVDEDEEDDEDKDEDFLESEDIELYKAKNFQLSKILCSVFLYFSCFSYPIPLSLLMSKYSK
jgi:hypothetical protein